MKIDVKPALKNPEQRFPFSGEFALPASDLDGDEPYGKAAYAGEYYGMGESVYFGGSAAVRVRSVCDRCGKPFDYKLSVNLADRFVPEGKESEDGSDFTYRDYSIDLDEYVREKLLLALPMHRLCRKNCKGLCPVCGQDLSVGTCNCVREAPEGEHPFAQLLKLKNTEK